MPMPKKIIEERQEASESSYDVETAQEVQHRPNNGGPRQFATTAIDAAPSKHARSNSTGTAHSNSSLKRNETPRAHTTHTKRPFGDDTTTTQKQKQRRQQAKIRKCCQIELNLLEQLTKVRSKRTRLVAQLQRWQQKQKQSCTQLPPVLNGPVIDMTDE